MDYFKVILDSRMRANGFMSIRRRFCWRSRKFRVRLRYVGRWGVVVGGAVGVSRVLGDFREFFFCNFG